MATLGTVSAWTGIRRWMSPDSYVNGQWIDKVNNGLRDRSMVNRHTGVPSVVSIGGKSWLNFNNAVKLAQNDDSQGSVINPSAFTIAFAWHPNSTADTDYLLHVPYEYSLVPDAAHKYLALISFFNTTNCFLQLGAVGASTTTIYQLSSGAGLLSLANPHIVLVSYSVARGYTLRVDSGVVNGNVASPTANQTITEGQVQVGGLYKSTGASNMLYGGIGDFYVFDIDLTGAGNASLLAAVEAQLTADWV